MLLAKKKIGVSTDRASRYKLILASRNALTKDNIVNSIVKTKTWPFEMLSPRINIQEKAQTGNATQKHTPASHCHSNANTVCQ